MVHLILTLALLAAPSPEITHLVPRDGTPEGWSRSGDPSLYEGGELFEYINGGADAYHDRGFERLAAQLFSKGDLEVQLEIYDMGSPEGAAAIFTENVTGIDTTTDFGKNSIRDEYQISFYRDRYYVSVLAYSSGEETVEAMATIARSVDSAIRAR